MLTDMTAPETDRTLLLMRHSKAEQVPGKRDIERGLTARGRRDAQAAGVWLTERGFTPDVVLCSSSQRTRQTWDSVAAAGVSCPNVRFDDRIYNASAGGLLEALTEAPDDAVLLLLIGHAPGVPWLADTLAAAGSGSQSAHDRLEDGLPTSAFAVLRVSSTWAALAAGGARLEDVVVPRG